MTEVVKNAKDNRNVVSSTGRKAVPSARQMVCWKQLTERKLNNASPMRSLPSPPRRARFILGRPGQMWKNKDPKLKVGEGRAGEWPAVFSGFPSQAHLDPTPGDRRNVQMAL